MDVSEDASSLAFPFALSPHGKSCLSTSTHLAPEATAKAGETLNTEPTNADCNLEPWTLDDPSQIDLYADLPPDSCPEGDRTASPDSDCRTEAAISLERKGLTSHPKQSELWLKELHHAAAVVTKLDATGYSHLADRIRDCHTHRSVIECRGCKKQTFVWNRCDVGWCPVCAPRLAYKRKQRLEWWTQQIKQPKHVVLTIENLPMLTKGAIRTFKACWNRLRRRAFARNWLGGFYSLEITDVGRGAHLHLHALVDARWIDQQQLATEWAKIVGQDIAIVHVSDCRHGDYLREVAKYAVKGSELAAWSGQTMANFIKAVDGVRLFGVFGSCYGKQKQWAQFLEEANLNASRCECGCDDYNFLSDSEIAWRETIAGGAPPRAVTPIKPQMEMPVLIPAPVYQQPR